MALTAAAAQRTSPARREPFLRVGRTRRQLARRLVGGMAPQRAGEALRLGPDELQAILGDADFTDLVDSYRKLRLLPRAELLTKLEDLAHFVLLELIEEREPRACAWFFGERRHGRDPITTLAASVADCLERMARDAEAEPPPRRKRRRPRPYDDLDALRQRTAAFLRHAVLAEHAAGLRARATVTATPLDSPASSKVGPAIAQAPTPPSADLRTFAEPPEPVARPTRNDTS